MQAHMPAVAADEYRTALSYDPENRQYRLRLAQALLAANRLNEARAHLTSLWELEPANGEVNLTLARLYVQRADFRNATRYYSNAINGVWMDDPRKQRIAARFELANYLMQQRRWTQAQSELMALLADGPRDPADQLRLGQSLLQVNEPEHTLEVDDTLLAQNSRNAEAWLQKGQALLALGRYIDAEHALASAVEHNPNPVEAQQQLELVRELLRIDPYLRGISLADRAKRVAEVFDIAMQRLRGCSSEKGLPLVSPDSASTANNVTTGMASAPATPPNGLQLLYTSGLQKQPSATEQALRKNPDAIDSTMQFVFEVERTTVSVCPNMNPTDQALLMLAQRESETQR